MISDGNAGHYVVAPGVTYQWTLLLTQAQPAMPGTPNWLPPHSNLGNGVLLDVDDDGSSTVSGPQDDSAFFLSDLGAVNDRWFAQLIVEECLNNVVVSRAASRGVWFGMAP